MLVIGLAGGLGNQLFQYAAGRVLAQRLSMPFLLDIHGFDADPLREYKLSVYQVQESFAPRKMITGINPLAGTRLQRLAFRLGQRLNTRTPWLVLREGEIDLHTFIPPSHIKYCYLHGYWQSERYFKSNESLIRQEFVLKQSLGKDARILAAKMQEVNAISVHVRRGDYVANPQTNRIHGTCSPDYYQRAVDYIADRVKEPHFFLFSDDPSWVAVNLNIAYPTTLVSANTNLPDYDELYLMSQCKHHIIANSSFSWWGAWLSEYADKLVVAPERWFANLARDTSHMLPAEWIRM